MKGTTLARRARKAGWEVTSRYGGQRIHIYQNHYLHEPLPRPDDPFRHHRLCGHSVHIHIVCDEEGNVREVTRSITEKNTHGDPLTDLAGIAAGWIEEGR